MLVSRRVDHRSLFADVRVIIIDEVHAFAGDDRGWHLLAVLERIQRLAGRPIQRIRLSATIGNPDEMLRWTQGSQAAKGRPGHVITEPEAAVRELGSTVLDSATARLHRDLNGKCLGRQDRDLPRDDPRRRAAPCEPRDWVARRLPVVLHGRSSSTAPLVCATRLPSSMVGSA